VTGGNNGQTRTEPEPQVSRGYRVLIAEDNPHLAEMYRYVLKKLAANDLSADTPLDVSAATNGQVAWDALNKNPFQLLITDLFMPVMDGHQLVARIRAEPALAQLAVIVITAAGPDEIERVNALGVTACLRKPVRFADVMQQVKRALQLS
jgi:CheY-like chemotaxis protein